MKTAIFIIILSTLAGVLFGTLIAVAIDNITENRKEKKNGK